MYSTCIFCHNDLGANETIEHFPIGRRLAFDAAKGRLWVVCRKCERWNLTPLEERWEAVEECERAFRETKLRVSSDHIGLGRVGEGLELVRIGAPQRPEFAAWRYGDQFGRRRKKYLVQTGAVAAGLAVIIPFGMTTGFFLGAAGTQAFNAVSLGVNLYRRMRVVARIPNPGGDPIVLRQSDVESAIMLPAVGREPWGLTVQHHVGRDVNKRWWSYDNQTAVTAIRGEQAVRIAAQLLPRMNEKAASAKNVKEAVELLEEYRDPAQVFNAAAKVAHNPDWYSYNAKTVGRMNKLAPPLRLALEMMSHEDAERRALEGELQILEDAWREAEEIAAISDNLFLPAGVSERFEEIKRVDPPR
ncbi:MAG: hypothetical protein M3Z54_09850 [Gemmatimonadota bacterium]|nr:hypothetical protein [Gemmatimonadota bacterium]